MFAKGIGLPVPHIICGRSLVGAAVLLAFLLAMRAPVKMKQPRHYAGMLISGLLLCAHWVMYFKALKISTAAIAILSLHTYPIFTALVEPVVFRGKLRLADVALAMVVLAGIAIMTPEIDLLDTTTRGVLLGIGSGIFFMARNLLVRKYVREYSGSCLMFWQMLAAGIVLLPFVAVGRVVPSSSHLGLLLLMGSFFTALPQALFAASFKHLTAKTVGIIATLLPFYGALFGYFIHE
jgi:drug/metabolite transporter (DMT)-like permease